MLALTLPNPLGPFVGFGADQVLESIGRWVASGAVWLIGQVGSVMSATTKPEIDAAWFSSHYRFMTGLGGALVLPLLLVSVLQAVVRQDLGGLVRTAAVQLPLALLLTAVAVTLVQLGLGAVDSASGTLARSAGLDTRSLLSGVATTLSSPAGDPAPPGIPLFVGFVTALLVAMGAFALWLELAMRTAAIYAATLFLPITMAGLVWPATSRWARQLAELLVALVVSKLVVVGVLSLAAGALSGGVGAADLSVVVGGAALLWVAAFSPFVVLKLVPVVEAGAIAHLEGVARRAPNAVAGSLDMLAGAVAGAGSGGAAGAEGVTLASGVNVVDGPGDDAPGGAGPRGGGWPGPSDGSGGDGEGAGDTDTEPVTTGVAGSGFGGSSTRAETAARGAGEDDRGAGNPGGRATGRTAPDAEAELAGRLLEAWVRTVGDEGPGPEPGSRGGPPGGPGR